MSGYEARCPSCGGTIVFALGTSLLKVCEHCGSAVARQGVNLADYGRVARLVPTPSVLALGLRGGFEGAPGFELVGRLQLDHGSGTWDEWLLGFDNGSWAWLAEAQGRFYYTVATDVPAVPAFDAVRAGSSLDLGQSGAFRVDEVKEARFVSAQGELPFAVPPGTLLRYADLSGAGGAFATIDYGSGNGAQALYVGRGVTLDELGLRPVAAEDRRAQAAADQLSCPQCGGPLELRAPQQTQRVGCPWCGSLLSTTNGLAVLETLEKPSFGLAIPLGTKGRLGGTEWTAIGAMERSVTVEGIPYDWREYLLYDESKGYRWLVESSDHWSFVQPVGDEVSLDGIGGAVYEGARYRHFQSGRARVDHVLGEFYWAVARGDEADTDDYVAPPHMLSREETPGEVTWSFGRYVEAEEIWKAFALEGRPPQPSGVGAHQPSPWDRKWADSWLTAAASLILLLTLVFVFSIRGANRVLHADVPLSRAAVSGAVETAWFSEPFDVNLRGNLQIAVKATVNNSWLYFDGALINEKTGQVDDFDIEVSYYSGTDSDGTWTEGGYEGVAYVGSVEPGRYVLRLAPRWAGRIPPVTRYDVAARSGVPRLWHWGLAAMALVAWPLFVLLGRQGFESARWSQSDHAPTGDDSDDDESDDDESEAVGESLYGDDRLVTLGLNDDSSSNDSGGGGSDGGGGGDSD